MKGLASRSEPVPVSAVGAITPCGVSAMSLWENLLKGHSRFVVPDGITGLGGIGPVGVVPDRDGPPVDIVDRSFGLGVFAGEEALRAAPETDRSDVAVVVGTAEIVNGTFREVLGERGYGAALGESAGLVAGLGGRIAERLRAPKRKALTLANASASGAMAVRLARDLVTAEECGAALAIGVDSLSSISLVGLRSLRLLDSRGCRPFNRDRGGIQISEGGAALLLGSMMPAGSTQTGEVQAYLLGCGASTAGSSPVRVDVSKIAEAIRRALDDSGCEPADIGMINSHGTGTVQGDQAEVQALRTIFGHRIRSIPITSWKPVLGHCQGAAGAVEAVATVLSVQTGLIPPTAGLSEIDPEFSDLDFTPETRRWTDKRVALTLSSGFGGTTVALIIGRLE